MKSSLFSFIVIGLAIYTAHAQQGSAGVGAGAQPGKPLDAASQKALQQTTELMTNKKIRDEAVSKDEKAKAADAYVDKVAGSKKEDVYGLASKIFERLVQKYGGDVEKLKAAISDAQRNPAAFAKEFTPEEMKALKDISAQLGGASGEPK